MKNIKISASALNSDLSELGAQVKRIELAGADMLHIDVMDGVFVEPLSVGDIVVKSLRDKTSMFFDAHLMVQNPDRLIERFAEAGSDMITIHAEGYCNVRACLRKIRSLGLKSGVSVSPGTEISEAYDYLDDADLLLVMAVRPGYGGQEFIPKTLEKIRKAKAHLEKHNLNYEISVDGGINEKTAPEAILAGADILVAGTYLFSAENMTEAVKTLKNAKSGLA